MSKLTNYIGFRMSPEKKAKIEQIATLENRTLSGQLNHVIDQYIEENEHKIKKSKKKVSSDV